MVSSIFDMIVTDGCGMKVVASSSSLGIVEDGWRIMMGFEVFFWRIWYFLSPWQSTANSGEVAFAVDVWMVNLH